jgi:hypothetical protein
MLVLSYNVKCAAITHGMFESFAGFDVNGYYTKHTCVHRFLAIQPSQRIQEPLLGWCMVALSNVYRITWASIPLQIGRKRDREVEEILASKRRVDTCSTKRFGFDRIAQELCIKLEQTTENIRIVPRNMERCNDRLWTGGGWAF